MPKVRTTFRPEDEVEVSETEAADLRRMGVLLDTKATTDEGARRAAKRKSQEG